MKAMRETIWAAVLSALACAASAQQSLGTIPYVPTPQDVVERMLETARVGGGDYVIDLGSGDGRLIRTAAAKFGARGFGVDIDDELVTRSNDLARREGVADRATFLKRDLFETDVSQATVVTTYLLPAVMQKIRPRLLDTLRPGTRIVSHDFDFGDWKPDQTLQMYSKDKYGVGGNSTISLWIVPAKVAGRWTWSVAMAGREQAYELDLAQTYQVVEGTLRTGGRTAKLENAKLAGAELRFTATIEVNGSAVKHEFSGRVAGDAIDGGVVMSGARVQGQREWSARRGARGAAAFVPYPVARN